MTDPGGLDKNVAATDPAITTDPAWHALDRLQRRVLGVLIEKAKTTPDSYPLTVNSLRNGCNQKSNRFPQLDLSELQIEETLEELRTLGAVSVVQGTSRSDKYRHLGYAWLGVDKYEIAVMGELLLRGAQTVGELRARAGRMEKIPGMTELRPILEILTAKRLILYLTPTGRGAILTHNLYQEQELEKVCADHNTTSASVLGRAKAAQFTPQVVQKTVQGGGGDRRGGGEAAVAESARTEPVLTASSVTVPPVTGASGLELELARRVTTLEQQLAEMRAEMRAIRTESEQALTKLRRSLEDLNQALGG